MSDNAPKKEPFFVGYLKVPKALKGFLLVISVAFVSAFAGAGLMAGVSQDDPGEAGFRFDFGRQTVSGVIEAKPYPILHVTEGNERIETGSSIMLTGQGKSGAMRNANDLNGKVVKATGIVLRRGDLDMLQLLPGKRGLEEVDQDAVASQVEKLGRWRIQGEICDGKCLAGAMQPGRGLAHKACANLCLFGGIPPVFVSSKPLEGEEFMMIGDASGNPLSEDAYHFVGQFVEMEADVERRGNMLVLLVDHKNIKVAQ